MFFSKRVAHFMSVIRKPHSFTFHIAPKPLAENRKRYSAVKRKYHENVINSHHCINITSSCILNYSTHKAYLMLAPVTVYQQHKYVSVCIISIQTEMSWRKEKRKYFSSYAMLLTSLSTISSTHKLFCDLVAYSLSYDWRGSLSSTWIF